MRIGILTQPLYNNYGGVLQNYALQTVLKKMGHYPITIDCIPQNSKLKWVASTLKSSLLWPVKRLRRPFAEFPRPRLRSEQFNSFLDKYIATTPLMYRFHSNLVERFNLDAIIVGSDQVWRPKYNPYLYDSFLDFAKHDNIKRIAYAASFGVGSWEYTPRETRVCKRLVHQFDAISVREFSGVRLCRLNFNVHAEHVLDPTLLLSSTEYEVLLDPDRPKYSPYLAAFVLDDSVESRYSILSEAKSRGLDVRFFSAGRDAVLGIEEWLALIHDAAYVVTDSFHGTVFSIIFGKEFRCLLNSKRGNERFDTLLQMHREDTIVALRSASLRFLSEYF